MPPTKEGASVKGKREYGQWPGAPQPLSQMEKGEGYISKNILFNEEVFMTTLPVKNQLMRTLYTQRYMQKTCFPVPS